MTELRAENSTVEIDDVLKEPLLFRQPGAGGAYKIYHFENEGTERPLVVYFGLGTTALTAMGRAYLQEYLQAIDRPIITIQPVTGRWENLHARAESDARVFDAIGIDEMDLVGASSGALLAAYVAAHAGGRVNHLVTASCVGTKEGYAEYIRSLPGQFLDGVKESISVMRDQEPLPVFTAQSSNFFNIKQYGELLKTIHQTVEGSLSGVVPLLDRQTKWIDIVGTKDHMTSYVDHLKIARERNESLPHSSSVHLLGGESHMWAVKRSLLAEIVRTAIRQ
jgi:pimeloyl-ACP methyl ester carboxylesterase